MVLTPLSLKTKRGWEAKFLLVCVQRNINAIRYYFIWVSKNVNIRDFLIFRAMSKQNIPHPYQGHSERVLLSIQQQQQEFNSNSGAMWGWRYSQKPGKSMDSMHTAWEVQKTQHAANTSLSFNPFQQETVSLWRQLHHTYRCPQEVIYKRLDFPKVLSALCPKGQWSNLYFLNGCGKIRSREERKAGHLGILPSGSALRKALEDYVQLAWDNPISSTREGFSLPLLAGWWPRFYPTWSPQQELIK